VNAPGQGYRCVLAPVDGSAFGEHALPLAATVAARAGALLCLPHVHVPPIAPAGLESVAAAGPWNDILKEQAGGYLEGLAGGLREAFGISVVAQVLDGPVLEALRECAEAREAGLVVMSTHGHAGIRRVWHHCVAEQLVEQLAIPALLVRPRDEDAGPDLTLASPLRHILLALSPDARALAAAEWGAQFGRVCGARFTLLELVSPGGTAPPERLELVAAGLRQAGLEVGCLTREAHEPGPAIVAAAENPEPGAAPVDLIAMERHPHRGFGQVLATHTTDYVIAHASVPVLLYPAESGPARTSSAELPLPSA
jgi:nucleotide-binding universal stress UspA family protein